MSALPGLPRPLLDAAGSFADGITQATVDCDAGTVHLKATGLAEGEAEARRLAWLDGRCGAPKLLGIGRFDAMCVLASEHLAATPTDSTENILAGEVSLHRSGRLLADLHALDPTGCLFLADRSSALARAQRRVAAGAVDPLGFPPALGGYRPDRLLELAAASIPGQMSEAPVICHGRAHLSHLLLGDGLVGLAGLGCLGLGDRYLDLAQLLGAVASRFGPEAMVPVLAGYGLNQLDRRRLDGYGILALLL